MSLTWTIRPLDELHKRGHFCCGETALDNYLKVYANQHAKKKISKTFIAASASKPEIVQGYYCLSAGQISFQELPENFKKKLPRYPIPIARLARLAVDKTMQGQGLGKYLLMDALFRCTKLMHEIGIAGIVVDARHEQAKRFYEQFGFVELTQSPLTLFISSSAIKQIII